MNYIQLKNGTILKEVPNDGEGRTFFSPEYEEYVLEEDGRQRVYHRKIFKKEDISDDGLWFREIDLLIEWRLLNLEHRIKQLENK